MARGSGLRCSSTGVPITTTRVSAVPTTAASVVATSRPEAMAVSSFGCAPGSQKGRVAALIRSTVAASTSYTATDAPLSASAMARGRPTCPPPPITTTSRSGKPSDDTGCAMSRALLASCSRRDRSPGPHDGGEGTSARR